MNMETEHEEKYDGEYHDGEQPEVNEDTVNITKVEIQEKKPRVYSLDTERKLIKEIYTDVYRSLTGKLDEEGNVPEFDMSGSNPWGKFQLQVMSLILKKPQDECHKELIAVKKHCVSIGTDFMTAVQTKNIMKYVLGEKDILSDMQIREDNRMKLREAGLITKKV